jgi:hypothetical protein
MYNITASGSTRMFPTVCLVQTRLYSVIEEHLKALQKKSLRDTSEVLSRIWTGFVIRLVLRIITSLKAQEEVIAIRRTGHYD